MLIKAFIVTRQEECPDRERGHLNTQTQTCLSYEVQLNAQIEVSLEKSPDGYQMVIQFHGYKDLSYSDMIRAFEDSEGMINCFIYHGGKLFQEFLGCESGMHGMIKQPKGQIDCIQGFTDMAVRIERLPRPYRTILRLHYLEGQSYSEMSQLLGRPKGTIKSLVSRGKKMLLEE